MLFEDIDTPPLESTVRKAPQRKRGKGSGTTTNNTTNHTQNNHTTNNSNTNNHNRETNYNPNININTGGGNNGGNTGGGNNGVEPEAPTAEQQTGWGSKDHPGGGQEISTSVKDKMAKHELPDVNDGQRNKDNQAAQDAKTGKDILTDDGYIEYIMGWEDFANKHKDVLASYGYGSDREEGFFAKAWANIKDGGSAAWHALFGGSIGTDSLAPALYSMYHMEDSVNFAAIKALADKAGEAHSTAQGGVRQQSSDMSSMGEAWVGEGGDAAKTHYGTNKGKSADDTINALDTAHAGIAATGQNIAELLNMKKQVVEDIANELKGVIGGNTQEHYEQLIELVKPGLFIAPGSAVGTLVNDLREVGVEVVDGIRNITEKVTSFLGKLYDKMKSGAQSVLHTVTFGAVDAPEASDHPGTDLANKLKAKLDELHLPNIHQAEIDLQTFVKVLQTAEQKVVGLCDKVHAKGHDLLKNLPPDPGQTATPPGEEKPGDTGGNTGGSTGGGRDPALVASDSAGSGSGSGSGGGDIGSALGAVGQALGSVGQALGQAVSGLGSALGGALQGLMGSIGQIIQAAQQAQQQAEQDKEKD